MSADGTPVLCDGSLGGMAAAAHYTAHPVPDDEADDADVPCDDTVDAIVQGVVPVLFVYLMGNLKRMTIWPGRGPRKPVPPEDVLGPGYAAVREHVDAGILADACMSVDAMEAVIRGLYDGPESVMGRLRAMDCTYSNLLQFGDEPDAADLQYSEQLTGYCLRKVAAAVARHLPTLLELETRGGDDDDNGGDQAAMVWLRVLPPPPSPTSSKPHGCFVRSPRSISVCKVRYLSPRGPSPCPMGFAEVAVYFSEVLCTDARTFQVVDGVRSLVHVLVHTALCGRDL